MYRSLQYKLWCELMLNQVKYLPTGPATDQDLLKQVKAQIKRDFGMVVDPFRLHALQPKLLAGVWAACRETELVGIAPRAIKELVAACVSQTNKCPYCVDAHTMLLNSVGEADLSKMISNGNIQSISRNEHKNIAKWALASRSPDSPTLLTPPFAQEWFAELIGMVVFYNYLNRMVHVFLPQYLLPVQQKGSKQIMKRLAGWFFSSSVNRKKPEGLALGFLVGAAVPKDFEWAGSRTNVAQGFAQMAAIIDELASEHIPLSVQDTFKHFLAQWRGEDAPLSAGWMEEFKDQVPAEQQAMLELSLMLIASSYRVTDQHIERFKKNNPKPETLLVTAAWASFQTARKIGGWLYVPDKPDQTINSSPSQEYKHAH